MQKRERNMKRILSGLLIVTLLLGALPLCAAAETEEPGDTLPEITDEMLDKGYLDDWFNDAVLVGDSLTAGLAGYVSEERYEKHPCLGGMQLAYASALTLKKAYESELHKRNPEIKFRKTYMTVSDIIKDTGAKKAFILLGVSDVRWYSAEELCQVYGEFLAAIQSAHPETMLIVISITPMLKKYAATVNVTAEQSIEANRLLKQFCEENGYYYLELAESLRGEDNFLIYEYSASDYRFHLNKQGKMIWIRLMRAFVRDLYNQGLYTPGQGE